MFIYVKVNLKESFRRGFAPTWDNKIEVNQDDVAKLTTEARSLIARNFSLMREGENPGIPGTVPEPTLSGVIEMLEKKDSENRAFLDSAAKWISDHGSDSLKLRWEHEESWETLYFEEVLRRDYPKWVESRDDVAPLPIDDAIRHLADAKADLPDASLSLDLDVLGRYEDDIERYLIVGSLLDGFAFYRWPS